MLRRPPRSTRTDTLFPYTTLFRSGLAVRPRHRDAGCGKAMEEARRDMREGAARIGIGDMYRALHPRFRPRDDRDRARFDRCGNKILHVEFFAAAGAENRAGRSEERRVGKEGVRKCRSRWLPLHINNNIYSTYLTH